MDAANNMEGAHNPDRYVAPAELAGYQTRALIVGAVGVIIAALGALLSGTSGFKHLMFGYLTAYVFWTGLAVGSLALLMLQFVARGAWGVTIRRIVEASSRTIPLMFVLFIPIVIGMHTIFHWTHSDVMQQDVLLREKLPYLTSVWFIFRTLLYFATWLILMYFINRWSAEQDASPREKLGNLMRNISGPGLVLYALTVSFASVDWVMSLDPHWYSTIFGMIFMGGWGLTAMSFSILVLTTLNAFTPMRGILSRMHFHDFGKFLLAFVMLWAYFNLSQFLIIWSGNLPEEIPWYLRRMTGGWEYVMTALVLFHFALPFLLLLTRMTKRNPRVLAMIAGLVFVMRYVDIFYLIAPEAMHKHGAPNPHHGHMLGALEFLPYIGLWLAIGGVWVWLFLRYLRSRPLLPVNDPLFERAITHGHGHGH